MNVQQCMKQHPVVLAVNATAQEAAHLFVKHHIGTLPVVDDQNQLVGILHLRDLLRLVMPAFVNLIADFDYVLSDFGEYEKMALSTETAVTPVRDLMETAVSVRANSGLLRAFAFLDKHDLYDLPVVDKDGRLVGIASRVDIGTALLTRWQNDQSTETHA